MLFSERKKIEKEYYKWIKENKIKDTAFNLITFLIKELEQPSAVSMIDFFIKHNTKVREGMAVEILRKAKEIEKDFDKTGLYEYIVANFLKEIKEE